MRKRIIISIVILLLTNLGLFAQVYFKVGCPRLNGDHGKEYVLDTTNFKAYLVSEDVSGWKIFQINLLNGASTQLNILANNPINSLYYRNDSLYIGGTFTTINGNSTAYKYFAVYNLITNALLPGMNAQIDGPVSEISIHKNKLFLVGSFNNVLLTPRKKIVSLNFDSSPLTISPVAFPSDLVSYLNSSTGTITKMKTYGDRLFFILDWQYLYSFSPYPPAFNPPTYHFSASFGGSVEDRLYDYELLGFTMYVAGNFSINSNDIDLGNLISNPSGAMGTNFGYDKLTAYDLYTGVFTPNFDNVSMLFQPSPNVYTNQVQDGALFGCTGFSFRKNRFNLVLSRSDNPIAGRNSIINADGALTNFSTVYYSEVSDPGGNAAYTPYNTVSNVRSFSNILTAMASQMDYHAGNYYPMSVTEDSLIIMRTGNADINGFSQSYGAFCKGDTITLKLKKQGNLQGYQLSYSGTGMNTLMCNSDSAKVVFNYAASSGNIKVYAFDNFNMATDTFYYPVTFKPIPDVNAGADKSVTCKNPSVKLTTTTTLTNYNVDWITPSGFTTLDSLNGIATPGAYYARIKDNITGCYGYDTVVVNVDTIKPNLIFPSTNNYTLTCKQNTQTIFANAVVSVDTVYWAGKPKYVSSSSIVSTAPGKLYVNCVASGNGCKRIDSVVIYQNFNPPLISNNVPKDSLTCIRDSVLLDGSSSAGNILFWRRPGFPVNDSIVDPIYTKLLGYHTLVVRDTSSGCKSTLAINVSNSALQPYVSVPSHTAIITCSQSFINLTGSSATTGALLNWQGPGSFSSVNPATVSIVGTYTVIATDPSNGCTKSDTVLVTKQNSLLLQSTNDTTICNGSSITITSAPNGGTLPYTYNWQGFGAATQLTVSPNDTMKYIVTISDAAGCAGKDSVMINVPKVLSDSTVTFQPCDPNNPNGQIQIFAKGGTAPYLYSLNGAAYQSSNIFSNLSYGNYSLNIKDAIGCTINSNTQINNNSLAPSSDFIVSTHLFQTDTFVVVDISNPKPDTVIWGFPSTFTVINNSNPYAPIVICSDTGYYNIQQTAYFGSCQTLFNKAVHITYNDGSYATNYNNNGIQNVTLSPNPNNGQFDLTVNMYKKQTFAVFVNDASGVEKFRIILNDTDNYSGNIVLPQVSNGTYVLKVVSAYDSKHVLFVVTQ